jgi:hypothetical protein
MWFALTIHVKGKVIQTLSSVFWLVPITCSPEILLSRNQRYWSKIETPEDDDISTVLV